MKDTSITIRLPESLKEEFQRAVNKAIINAIDSGQDFRHITTSEIVRLMIRKYTMEMVG